MSMMIKSLGLTLLMFSQSSVGSTFIGNGGNAGDLDLAVTLQQIHETIDWIDKEDQKDLCRCPAKLSEARICEVFKRLTKEQRNYCQARILALKPALTKITGASNKIEYTWTDDPLFSNQGPGKKRSVDALANHKQKKIVIQRSGFLDLSTQNKIALLTHELIHLIVDIDDFDQVGPFDGPRGGGRLLDVIGGTIALTAHDIGLISGYRPLVRTSRAAKPFMVALDGFSLNRSAEAADDLYLDRQVSSRRISFAYRQKHLGYGIGHEWSRDSKKQRDSITVEETMGLYQGFIQYRWYPLSAQLSRWSEMFVEAQAFLMWGKLHYSVADGYVQLRDETKGTGYGVGGTWHLPIQVGFWARIGLEWRQLQYEYKSLNIQVRDSITTPSIGVGYGF